MKRRPPSWPPAPRALTDWLDAPALQAPIRAEIFGAGRFAQHGRSLGLSHHAVRAAPRAAAFLPRLDDNLRMLRRAHAHIDAQAAAGFSIPPAAEWLLDNFHLVEAQLERIHEAMPRSTFRALPVLRDEPLAGLPRIHGVAWAFIAHTDGAFDETLLVDFLLAYQDSRELTLGEMWALPTTLRMLLIENLRRLAERAATGMAAHELAVLALDHLDGATPAALDDWQARLARRGVDGVFQVHWRRGGGPFARAPDSLRESLSRPLPERAALLAQQVADQTADNLSMGNAVNALRAIGDADWPDLVARASPLMARMLTSPVFAAEHPATRDRALHAIERLARRCRQTEGTVATTLCALMAGAQPPGPPDPGATDWQAAQVPTYWLLGDGRPALLQALGHPVRGLALARRVRRAAAVPLYLALLAAGTFGLLAMLHAGRWPGGADPLAAALAILAALALALPASETVVAVLNRLVSEWVRPAALPRLLLAGGIPPSHRVLVVVPAILDDAATAAALARRLLLHHLANPEPEAQFALLTDLPDAPGEHAPGDADRLAEALAQIDALNARHPGAPGGPPRFLLLHRPRLPSATEQSWIGWERKRGKLEQLLALLAQGGPSPFADLGEASRLAPGVRHLLTLDSDTRLPPGRLRLLVGVAAHPLNRPRLAGDGRRVVAGYGILQPRVVTPLPAAGTLTAFHWLFAGQPGIDPYSAASSEVYQDLFDEGSFSGKGLLDVAAMQAVLGGRLPPERVLSHDLIEGAIARCAAVTDVELLEDAPFRPEVAAARIHRWTRGDWQLLPFLAAPRRWSLSAANRWKLTDNLRRSLVPPAGLMALGLSLAGHGPAPAAVLGLALASFSAGPLLGAVAGLAPSRDTIAKRPFYRQAGLQGVRALAGAAWLFSQWPAQAGRMVDAIGRTLWRLAASRRHLLQWARHDNDDAPAGRGAPRPALGDGPGTVVTVLALGALALAGPHPVLCGALAALWALAPLLARQAGRPLRRDGGEPPLTGAEADRLHDLARDTWRLFERWVGPDDRHLPADNLQTLPSDALAHRTSPTNIGLYLLAAACAREFGWLGTLDLLARLEATLGTLGTLARHRGHFLNWYDTQTGALLPPAYVSTVDSGNLCGHLLATAQACRAFADDALAPGPAQRALAQSRRRLAGSARAARDADSPACWARADHLSTLRGACADARARRGGATTATAARLRAVADTMEALAWAPAFGFLYDRRRHLLHIGWRVTEQRLDTGFYDLLASESRLASLLAIAKGDVPVAHWAALGRPFLACGARVGLRSWSGSMFEYLMPTLMLDEPPGSLLQQAAAVALREQRAFARARGVPWGISESAHAARDHTLAYQYAPQGVPRLALRRTPPQALVVAPYATALAAQIAPRAAGRNFAALAAMGARRRWGAIESIDFSVGRRRADGGGTPVFTHMAHHQGMTVVALANVLHGAVVRRWAMAQPHLEAVASLLHEPVPAEVSPPPATRAGGRPVSTARTPTPPRDWMPGVGALAPTHLLSNGRHHVALRAHGGGFSRLGATGLTRWRDDALRDADGSAVLIRRAGQRHPVSLTAHPAPDPAAHYDCTFHGDRVEFTATWPDLHSRLTVWVSPEDDIEFRQVELTVTGPQPLSLSLISVLEPTLAPPAADEAHPAFSNLFLQAAWRPESQALVFRRLPRHEHESAMQMAHFVVETSLEPPHRLHGVQGQTDRQRWRGRNRALHEPLAELDDWAVASPSAAGTAPDTGFGEPRTTGLDPIAVLARPMTLAPGVTARLTFATTASTDAGVVTAVIDKYRQVSHVQRASLMSATLADIRWQALALPADHFAALQWVATALLMHLARPDAAAPPDGEDCDRRALWRFGLSGERPILLVSADTLQGAGLLRALARALPAWAWAGVDCDLVFLDTEPASYPMPVLHEMQALRERHEAERDRAPGAGHTRVAVLRADELSALETATLHRLARLHLVADGRGLPLQVRAWRRAHDDALQARTEVSAWPLRAAPAPARAAEASQGRFDADGARFEFAVDAGLRPTRPWTNVLANPGFGALLTESGGGHTWALNSRMNQVTAWGNDPVADTPAEWFLLQDRRSRETWSLTPSAWGAPDVRYEVSVTQGRTRISHRRGDLVVQATWCTDAQAAVKQVRLTFTNAGPRAISLRAVALVEWLLGARRADRATLHTALHHQRLPGGRLTALLATQCDRGGGFGRGTAFLATVHDALSPGGPDDWTCDRRECFDARGRPQLPDHFGRAAGSGGDPCAALSLSVDLAPGASAQRVFLIGWAADPQTARQAAARAAEVPPGLREAQVAAFWDDLLGATTVRTPDPLFDALVNRWLLYQTVSSRLWAKAGFYQAGGATGFRDQLQDSLALAWAAPAMLREQVLRCTERQYPEGDVQHWWHTPGGAGVRTRISDDLLWLPLACAHHLRATGDATLLDETRPFLTGGTVPDDAEDLYETPAEDGPPATVYEHAARAIDHSLRTGAHGLPLIGGGDWNDGMNRVGRHGRGESVWLGFFLCRVVADFAPLARARGDADRAARWEDAAAGWQAALLGAGWDGHWFRRAWFDDGTPLGTAARPEAQIDLIAQAWAVLSGVAPRARRTQAMAAVAERLADPVAGLLRLLDPPLTDSRPDAGYIQAYPPGVRENGGQYTHGALWAVMAQAALAVQPRQSADAARQAAATAWTWFTWLSPAHRAADPVHGAVYGVEPYLVAGDTSSQAPYAGRGGWSGYTGAAGWMHRTAIESLFGLRLSAADLCLRPCLPPHWREASLTLTRDGRRLHFLLRRGAPVPQALPPGWRLLHPGEALPWAALGGDVNCLVPL